MALRRVWIPSPNYSSRGGSSVRLIVVHTAEGALTYQSLGSFSLDPSSQVSSQTGIDDTPGTIGEYVKRSSKSWTQANYNPMATSTELCAFAEWSAGEWEKHPNMLANVAAWIAEEAAYFGLPITKLSAGEAQGNGRGVCGHKDLGSGGGNHWDPGNNFPWERVLEMARGDAPAAKPASVWGALPFLGAIGDDDMAFPDYVINDVSGGSRKFAVYGSGLVRRLSGKEWQYLRDEHNVRIWELNDKDEGDRLYQLDQALRGQVKERE